MWLIKVNSVGYNLLLVNTYSIRCSRIGTYVTKIQFGAYTKKWNTTDDILFLKSNVNTKSKI